MEFRKSAISEVVSKSKEVMGIVSDFVVFILAFKVNMNRTVIFIDKVIIYCYIKTQRGRCPQSLYAALAKADEIFLIFCPKYRNCGTRMSRKARGWARMAHRGRFRPLP